MDDFLKDKTALVTGGTRGIGYAIARQLGLAGADVLICGRSEEGVNDAVQRLRDDAGDATGSFEGRVADVSKWNDVEDLFQFARRKWNKLDVLVNNAGVGVFKPVAELSPEEWHQVIDLNLSGLYYCCHAGLPLLRESGEGYVFNISSLAGRNPFAGGSAYNASKFGVNGFSEAMMLDHRKDNVRVTLDYAGQCRQPISVMFRVKAAAEMSGRSRLKTSPMSFSLCFAFLRAHWSAASKCARRSRVRCCVLGEFY